MILCQFGTSTNIDLSTLLNHSNHKTVLFGKRCLARFRVCVIRACVLDFLTLFSSSGHFCFVNQVYASPSNLQTESTCDVHDMCGTCVDLI